MSLVVIYHNPRCSKSRQTLVLLRDRGIEPTIIEYLNTPPDPGTLRDLLWKLGMRPADLLRRNERPFTDLSLADRLDDDDALIRAMTDHPILIERPIVVRGESARIGRPPEAVIEIL